MEFSNFIQFAFYAVAGGSIPFLITILKDLSNSVNELNKNVAVMIKTQENHQKSIDRHEVQIEKIMENLK